MEAGDRARVTAVVPAATRSRSRTGLLLVALAAIAGGLPSFSLGANLFVLTVGGALFVGGLAGARRSGPAVRPFPPGARWWLLPVGGLLLLEALNFLAGSTYDHPTLSQVADPWLERYPVRAGAFLGWLTAFWALARR
jgi:hypothetical protein